MKVILLFLLTIFSTVQARITAAVAANMQPVMEELSPLFKDQTGIEVTPVFESSGKLVAQIKNGAPFDIFLSADMARPESLVVWGLAKGKVKTYAYGSLVLWTVKDIDLTGGIRILKDPSIKTIALGDFTTTVYGPASKLILQNTGLWDQIEGKCVYGGSIAQVAHYIATGSVDIGFAAKSAVLSESKGRSGRWIDVDSSYSGLLPQGVVVLNQGLRNSYEVMKFYFFLFSESARKILVKYGYRLP